jgi:hypothetical protein
MELWLEDGFALREKIWKGTIYTLSARELDSIDICDKES